MNHQVPSVASGFFSKLLDRFAFKLSVEKALEKLRGADAPQSKNTRFNEKIDALDEETQTALSPSDGGERIPSKGSPRERALGACAEACWLMLTRRQSTKGGCFGRSVWLAAQVVSWHTFNFIGFRPVNLEACHSKYQSSRRQAEALGLLCCGVDFLGQAFTFTWICHS